MVTVWVVGRVAVIINLKIHYQRIVLLALLFLLGGCETFSYYGQAVNGHWAIWQQRQSIASIISDDSVSPALKQQLQTILTIREFASTELQLPNNGSYRYYADIQRQQVVWNVFAAEEFAVTPKKWCFPVAGCVSYRGYFSEQAARGYANKLSAQGFDSYVGAVAAYSTLGWFDDPVLNTFLYRDELDLAGLIFHELAHQQLYLAGDTAFNESFASAVEMAGIERWLARQQPSNQQATDDLHNYLFKQRLQRDFVAMLLQARKSLAQLYRQPLSASQKRARKQQIFTSISMHHYVAFKAKWQSLATSPGKVTIVKLMLGRYDQWINHSLNNAKLASLASYYQWQSAFTQLLNDCNGEFSCFYRRTEKLSKADSDVRAAQLNAYLVDDMPTSNR